jgi:hypothetical protein
MKLFNRVKVKFYIVSILFLFLRIQIGSSQTFTDRNNTVPLPENVKAFANRCNQTLFGKNAFVFEPFMDMAAVQTLIDSIYAGQVYPGNEFSKNRYALLFKPGTYKLDVRVGYYMHIMGLGNSPEDVVIVGAVRANASQGHVLCNFWRAVENLTIVPTLDSTNTNIWAVSQAAPLRRVYVKGNLKLYEGASSGGFMADCKIDGIVFSGSQQQWLTRNSIFNNWHGGVWNMMYMGVTNAPQEDWPGKPVTTIKETPSVREKPYWVSSGGKYILKIPALKYNSIGVDWDMPNNTEKSISMDVFYVAKPGIDNAKSINKALKNGKHILFTPGIYSLSESLKIKRSGTIMMGIGTATLVPEKGNKAIEVSDVDGITIASLLIDASVIPSETLMQIGETISKKNHQSNPSFLYDVFFRVGGPHEGSVSNCLMVNSNNVVIDHVWLWRADHGNGIGWDKSKCANGLIVNGDNVTIYGLFNEHFQEYQAIWNGERGRVYFYQSEMPYDPPSLDKWKHGAINGYASYKVGDYVKDHQAWGVGIYNVFYDAPVIVDQAIETPAAVENNFYHKVIIWLNGNKESLVKSIINGKGEGVNNKNRKSIMK